MREPLDVCVIGSGPAGLALALACAERGLRVALVAPQPRARWSNNYGVWLDDAERFGLLDHAAQRWARSEVVIAGAPLDLGRGYVRLDNARWQADMLARGEAAGLVVHAAEVVAVEHDDEQARVALGSGASLDVRLVVDASGHASRFVAREQGPPPAYQVAWGELHATVPVELDAAADAMRFMDWTPSPAASDGLPPSFLYAMLLPGGQLFVEETVLVGRPRSGDPGEWFEPLRARLHARLPSLARGPAPRELERCVIAMGSPLPRRGQPTLAFGAAASFVHPATGYMLGVMLQRRERVATAIAEARAAGLVGAAARRVVEPAIWSASERRAWQLYAFGMEVLVDLDHAGVERFFAEFFALPPARWRGFLAGSDATATLMATMLRYYARAAPPIRRRLTAHLLGRDGLRLARNLVGGIR